MRFRRFPCDGLAQACYVLADGDEAIVVDPRRDVADVLAWLQAERLRAVRVLATHVHADFVVGLLEVAAATGARVGLGERFTGRLPCDRLADGELVRVGGVDVRVLATPGHTLESVSYFVPGAAERPPRLLSGDTLFVGEVGRPDLAQGAGRSPESMAALLFATLRDRVTTLPDDTELWPGHGAGSACGASIGSAPSSTLAHERITNWALRAVLHDRDEAAFVRRLLAALRPPPRHFTRLAAVNHAGAPLVATLPDVPRLDVAATTAALAAGAGLLDVRPWTVHGRGHWPGALNVGLDGGDFEPWAGALLDPATPLVLHAETGERAHDAVTRLRRVGLDAVRGFVLELPSEPARTPQLDALDLFAPGGERPFQVVDVRSSSEYAVGHVPGAVHAELGPDLANDAGAGLDRTHPTAVLCEGGYRSSAAIALLRARGFTQLHNVHDGMRGWRANHLPLA